MNVINNIGWNFREIITEAASGETLEGIAKSLDETINNDRIQQHYIKLIPPILFKDVMNKIIAMSKTAIEQGLHPNVTPYRDARLLLQSYLSSEDYKGDIPSSFDELRMSRKGIGKVRSLSGSEINKVLSDLILMKSPQERGSYLREFNTDFNKFINTELQSMMKGTLSSRYWKGAKGKAAETELLSNKDIEPALSRDLSTFTPEIPPHQKFEQGIPENRIDINELKRFIIDKLQIVDDFDYTDDILDIVDRIEGYDDINDLEDFLTTKSVKYKKIADREDSEIALYIYNVLSDGVDYFRNLQLYNAVNTAPEKIAIAPDSNEAIKDELVYNFEDAIVKYQNSLPVISNALQKVLDNVKSIMKSKGIDGAIAFIDEKIGSNHAKGTELSVKFSDILYQCLLDVKSHKQMKSTNEPGADKYDRAEERESQKYIDRLTRFESHQQKNNLLVDQYRNRIKQQVIIQEKYGL